MVYYDNRWAAHKSRKFGTTSIEVISDTDYDGIVVALEERENGTMLVGVETVVYK